MKNVANDVLELVGKTPMLYASRYSGNASANSANILVKLECLNPTGSAKDRAALAMICEAEEKEF